MKITHHFSALARKIIFIFGPLIQRLLLGKAAHCNLDWDNHQTLTLGHLKTVNFYSFPKEIRFNLLHHALNNSNKPGDFFEFFLNQTTPEVRGIKR